MAIMHTVGGSLARLLVTKHASAAILVGTMALAAGGAAALNQEGDHDGGHTCAIPSTNWSLPPIQAPSGEMRASIAFNYFAYDDGGPTTVPVRGYLNVGDRAWDVACFYIDVDSR